MLAAGLTAVALLAQQTSTPPVPAPATDGQSIVAEILARQPQQAPDMAALHAEAAGVPDPVWSPATEETLSQRYDAVPGFAAGVTSFDIMCSATICEAAGMMRSDLSVDQVNDLMTGLQGPETGRVPGLEHVLHHFGSIGARAVFASYWRRSD